MTKIGFVSLPREYLKYKRLSLGYSVELASRKLDVSRYYYYQIENGNRGSKLSIDLMLKISKVLEIDKHDFLESEIKYVNELKELNKKYYKNKEERWRKKTS